MTKVDSLLKSRDITLPTQVHLVKAMVFPIVMYGCESWTIKKAECWWIMLLNYGVGEDSSESFGQQGDPTSPSKRKSVLNIHCKDWCWSWSSNTLATWCEELTHWKGSWCWEDWRWEEKGMTEDEMVAWHHRMNGHEFELTPGVDGQRGLACCNPWGCKVSNTSEQLNWTELNHFFWISLF